HGARAAKAFFGGLEDEDRLAVEIAGLGEIASGTEKHGRMAVMAAAVELARRLGTEGEIGFLVHGQCIHIGAQSDRTAIAALAVENADHTRLADAGMDLDAPGFQLLGDDAGSAL